MRERERLLRQIVLHVVQRCPQCQHPFEKGDLRLVGQDGDDWLFSLHCRSCRILAVVGLAMPAESEVFPEMEWAEAAPAPLSADDVLEMHLYLESQPDLRDLLDGLDERQEEKS